MASNRSRRSLAVDLSSPGGVLNNICCSDVVLAISVNGGITYGPDMPFGGYKHSGIGRQNGDEGFEQFLETKTLAWPRPQRGG